MTVPRAFISVRKHLSKNYKRIPLHLSIANQSNQFCYTLNTTLIPTFNIVFQSSNMICSSYLCYTESDVQKMTFCSTKRKKKWDNVKNVSLLIRKVHIFFRIFSLTLWWKCLALEYYVVLFTFHYSTCQTQQCLW